MNASSLVTLADYGDAAFGGSSTPDEIRELAKALSAGADINNPGAAAGRGFPLRVEALDDVLKVVTFGEKDLVFWKEIPKKGATNTIEEFNRLTSVGNEDGIFIGEGELPEEDDSTYERLYSVVKFMGTLRRITHPMMVIKNALPDSVMAAEARAGTLKLLRGLELRLWDGDSTADGVEFDGFFRSFIDGVCGYANGAGNVVGSTAWSTDIGTVLNTNLIQDMRYSNMTEDMASDMVTYIADDPNHGEVTDCYMPFTLHKDFSKQLYPKERASLSQTGEAGIVVNRWNSPFGKVDLKPSKFIRMSGLCSQTGSGNLAKRPNAPTLTSITTPAVTAAWGPGFGGAVQGRTAPAAIDGAGNYAYQITACNRYGESVPLTVAPTAFAVGDEGDLAIVDGSPPGVTTHYKVYRTFRGAATGVGNSRYIFRVKRTAAAQTIVDANRFLPGTGRSYWIQRNLQSMAWKQLLPLLKINLAQIDLAVRFAMVLYGTFVLYAPRKNGMAINVGPLV